MAERRRRPRVYRARINPFEAFDDLDFFQRYRFNKATSRVIIDAFVNAGYGRQNDRGYSVSDDLMVLTAIRFYATGSMYRDIADTHGVSRSTVTRAVAELGDFLYEHIDEFVRMPNTAEEMYRVAEGFQVKTGMPRCLGAVDGTHINIIAPRENEAHFINRHQSHSLNVQAWCDSNMIFTSVDAHRCGGTHDNFTFVNSDLGIGCTRGDLGDYFLIGDSGYALRPFIMTPILRPDGQAELRYNQVHKHARSVIERAFGRLKARFRCLSNTGGYIQTSPEKASRIIVACCVLHNIAELSRMPLPEPVVADFLADENDQDDDDAELARIQRDGNAAGARVRAALLRDVFQPRL